MRQRETWGARLHRESLGIFLEIGVTVVIMAIGLLIALIATRGRF